MLFDLDGTLVDSVAGIWASIRVAVAELGLAEPTPEQLRSMVGPPLEEGFEAAFGIGGDDVVRAVRAYRAHYSAGAMFQATVYPGIADLLARLGTGGATLAVATSKPEDFAVRILAHVGLLPAFASVHGATWDGSVRHKEQVVAAALAAHPDGRQPVLVGDRAQDVRGAGVHGLPCIGAGWGPAPEGELVAAGAAVVAGTPAEVPAALDRLAAGAR
ncbi:HAD family hydrolase [Modestobacter lapidis]